MIFALATATEIAVWILGGVLIALSVILAVVVMLQSAKDKRLSGTIAGGAETFFGKTKGAGMDKTLSTVTIVVSVIEVLAILAMNILLHLG